MNKQEQLINNDVMPYAQAIEKATTQHVRHCNMCGKDFDLWDEQENFEFNHFFGYGSMYDYMHINFHLCCNCADKLLSEIILKLKDVNVCEQRGYADDMSIERLKKYARVVKKEYKEIDKRLENK